MAGIEPVELYDGLRIVPTTSVAGAGRLDVLVVPGAIDLDAVNPDAAVRELAARSDLLASVCTGSFLLQRVGLVGDRVVTTHWEDVAQLAATGARVRDDVRWVDSGTLVTRAASAPASR